GVLQDTNEIRNDPILGRVGGRLGLGRGQGGEGGHEERVHVSEPWGKGAVGTLHEAMTQRTSSPSAGRDHAASSSRGSGSSRSGSYRKPPRVRRGRPFS